MYHLFVIYSQLMKPYLTLLAISPLLLACSASSLQFPNHTPKIIAHRGGTTDAPENTIYAIEKALQHHADEIWITIQLSQDQQPILYRPRDLATHTNLSGSVSQYSAHELKHADAAWSFNPSKGYPLRGKGITIPTLAEVLQRFPTTHFYLDLKSPDADPYHFAAALVKVIDQQHARHRVRVYSTQASFLKALPTNFPVFANRDSTRTLLIHSLFNPQTCSQYAPKNSLWHGFEWKRKVTISEHFTLGKSENEAETSWQPNSIKCFNSHYQQYIIVFGIRTLKEYQQAAKLGVYGVMVDSPQTFRTYLTD